MKLTKRDVLHIFAQRAQVNNHESNALTSRQLATKYGISERTVRDIWTRRSRTNITMSHWTDDEKKEDKTPPQQRVGRPPGAKDTAPRKRQRTSGSEQETSSSDSGTARQSDTTGSRNQNSGDSGTNSGDSGENSNSSQQEGSSSASGRENSSSGSGSGSGSSSPQQTTTAPTASEQIALNDQLNQAVLSRLNTDWRQSVTTQQFRTNMLAPTEQQAFAPTNSFETSNNATKFAQLGAWQGLQQPLANTNWSNQDSFARQNSTFQAPLQIQRPPSTPSNGQVSQWYGPSVPPTQSYAQDLACAQPPTPTPPAFKFEVPAAGLAMPFKFEVPPAGVYGQPGILGAYMQNQRAQANQSPAPHSYQPPPDRKSVV